MCGLFGIALLSGSTVTSRETFNLSKVMFEELEHRGRRASGIALINRKRITVVKKAMDGSTFVNLQEFSSLFNYSEQITFIIGHCRLDTKGTPSREDNNHPMVVGNVIGVHNGVIVNDDLLFDSYGASLGHRKGTVDSEIIFSLINYHCSTLGLSLRRSVVRTCEKLAGSYACAAMDMRKPDTIALFRETHPIAMEYFPTAKTVIFASERYAIEKAGRKVQLGSNRQIIVPPHSVLVLNTSKKLYSINSLTDKALSGVL